MSQIRYQRRFYITSGREVGTIGGYIRKGTILRTILRDASRDLGHFKGYAAPRCACRRRAEGAKGTILRTLR